MADLRQAFSLSKAEDRVARRILCGEQTKVIAASLGVAEATVHRHVKAILAKTGTRRQTDFVRCVATLDGWNAGQYAEAI
jgi:DNA-binding NarL/FixJ family response regulator